MPAETLISFSIGPVQPFIAAAKSTRDLWTGSILLAWLTRHAMSPWIEIEKGTGTTLIVSPFLNEAQKELSNWKTEIRNPCIPNQFVVQVDADTLDRKLGELIDETKRALFDEWRRICDNVFNALKNEHVLDLPVDDEDKRRWDAALGFDSSGQVQQNPIIDFKATVLPLNGCQEQQLQELLHADQRAKPEKTDDALWSDQLSYLFALSAVGKMARNVHDYRAVPDDKLRYPQKCSILGSYEQFAPADLAVAADFWDSAADEKKHLNGTHIRANERLCPLSLVKRFAWVAYLEETLFGKNKKEVIRVLNSEDTATVAAKLWLAIEPEIDHQVQHWSGQYLFDENELAESSLNAKTKQAIRERLANRDISAPPIYYAVIIIDGDSMGKQASKFVGRSRYAGFSQSISRYASQVAAIVEKYGGQLIYCGGDDVLALIPAANAIACGKELAETFAREVKSASGDPLSASAGIVIAHHKEDLQFVIKEARSAEKTAKAVDGKNAFALKILRHNGEHSVAVGKWDFAETLQHWVTAFKEGASDRWAYQLSEELETLTGLSNDAMRSELKRFIKRSDKGSQQKLVTSGNERAYEQFADWFDGFADALVEQQPAKSFNDFVTLVKSASFIARGKD